MAERGRHLQVEVSRRFGIEAWIARIVRYTAMVRAAGTGFRTTCAHQKASEGISEDVTDLLGTTAPTSARQRSAKRRAWEIGWQGRTVGLLRTLLLGPRGTGMPWKVDERLLGAPDMRITSATSFRTTSGFLHSDRASSADKNYQCLAFREQSSMQD